MLYVVREMWPFKMPTAFYWDICFQSVDAHLTKMFDGNMFPYQNVISFKMKLMVFLYFTLKKVFLVNFIFFY